MMIRVLTSDDAERYRALRLRALREHPEAFLSTYEAELDRPIEMTRSKLAPEAGKFTLGAMDEHGELAGVATLVRETNPKVAHKANVYAVYVAPEARGQRVGMSLMQALIAEARACDGVEQLHLTVMASNEAAVRLYTAAGFAVYGTEPRAMRIGGTYFDDHHMVFFL
ncbi:GNAT family N-acetyltransferase [Paenibacillus methanolicus]|uniref:Acetyltransferase (GNAT) family protein n=1 Tax=Paenibacillus methanolicus TaxID=582686 RepID=A0A5S5BUU2_9BACL|nr:GNAT family N-acetyltransferase [Paenibacillus methanolicus]TYP70086.1 acetyltransferase (GNAT) family protein [Paenibacillus methanolicus]